MFTLKDIAKEAGVSVMTVSRVVNKRYSEVSQDNIERIEAIIAKHGYVPNNSARSLSSHSSRIIAVIIQGDSNQLQTPYNASILGHIIKFVQDQGYNTMVHFISDYSDVTKHIQSWNADGAIFLGAFDYDVKQIQADNKIPLVFTDNYSPIRQIINIGIDDYKGGVLAAQHFIEHGHKRFAFCSPSISDSMLIRQRLKGFSDTITAAGCSPDDIHIIEQYDGDIILDTLKSYSQPVTALFFASDSWAMEAICRFKELGVSIPEDYSVIGFDNLPLCKYITPALTTISQDICKKAHYAVNVLFEHLKGNDIPMQNIVLDVSLVVRNSVIDMPPHTM